VYGPLKMRVPSGPLAPRTTRKILGLAALLLLPGLAVAGQVKGKLLGVEKLMNPVWKEAKDNPHRYTWRELSPTVRSEFRALFAYAPKEVCVVLIGGSSQQPGSIPTLITVGGGRTTPVTVVIVPGTRLRFENRDPFPHKIYAVGQPSFPPGEMAALAGRDWMAPGPGKYEIRDELSPSVRSFIVVEPNVVAVTYPSQQGVFQFAQAIAPGEYTLRAYFAGAPVGTPKALTVGAALVDVPMAVAEGADKKPDGGK
jgi:hypothetical protein